MYQCVKKSNYYLWNTDFEKAKQFCVPHQHIPRIALTYACINGFLAGISGESSAREVAFSDLEQAEHSLKNCYYKEDILKLIQQVKDLNKECISSSSNNKTSVNSESLIATEDDFDIIANKNHSNYLELEEMTPDQQYFNYELDLKLCDAENHLLRGLLQFMGGSYLRGFYNFRKSYLKYKEVYHQVEDLKNESKQSNKFVHSDVMFGSYFGMGMFNFIISVLPPTLAKILSVLGFDADRELGLDLMTQCSQYGGLHCGHASFMLCINYLFVPRAFNGRQQNLTKVKPILDMIARAYPNSVYFKFVISHYDLKTGNLEGCLNNIRHCVNGIRDGTSYTPYNYLTELGIGLMLSLKLDEAEQMLTEIVEKQDHMFDSKGNCALFLVVCRIFKGDLKRANELISKLSNHVSKSSKLLTEKIELLKHVKSDAEKQLVMVSSFFQLLYLRRDLANLKPHHIEPLFELFNKHTQGIAMDEKSKVHGDLCAGMAVIRAQVYNVLGQHDKSLQEFHNALSYEHKIKYEKQWIAFSYYELAENKYLNEYKERTAGQDVAASLSESNKKELVDLLHEVKEHLVKCNKYSGYPFEEVLHTRAKLALKQVEEDLKAVSSSH
ncbi:hypothetical protein C9374_011037 [Naegleria lovaniensis]|uniref:Uncharacterized protein n=1 Tax=Naegleria lovaniensis TaxID=51637 RepID=A0AA88GEW4_NAELO|nr:uncharacterized protein C9374_011037 [Naegleria lovaniensis]KAG2374200.1 hypothetical protein C9374_011037 [Naegleria lovaniensis]